MLLVISASTHTLCCSIVQCYTLQGYQGHFCLPEERRRHGHFSPGVQCLGDDKVGRARALADVEVLGDPRQRPAAAAAAEEAAETREGVSVQHESQAGIKE